jgi:hypothetical protein
MDDQPHKNRRRIILALVAIGIVAIAGIVLVPYYVEQNCPPLVGCGPYPTLSIQNANAQVGSNGPTLCQKTQLTAVCPVNIAGGDSGRVTITAAFEGVKLGEYVGGMPVEFLVYSSAASYVSFNSIPSCASTSGPSLNGGQRCQIPSNGQAEFQFDFTVSQNYNTANQEWPDSVTVTMWQTAFP